MLKKSLVLVMMLLLITSLTPSVVCAVPLLEGRIEAIVKPNATLPAPVLKMQVAQLDTTLLDGSASTNVLNAGAMNYPDYLVGKWGGELKTTWVGQTADDGFLEFKRGSVGKTVFEFARENRQSIRLKPNCVYYPARVISHEEFLRHGARPEKFGDKQLQVKEHKTFTKLDLSTSKLYHPDGSTTEYVIALNELKTLRRGVVEQDRVVKEFKSRKFDGFKETVLRFTWHRKDLVFAEIGIVKYGIDGKISDRSILQGWLTPNWQKIADEISRDYGFSWERIQQYGVEPGSK